MSVGDVVGKAMGGGKKKENVNLGSKGRFQIKKGAMTAKAQAAGESNKEFEQKNKTAPGTTGREARLAITMGKWNKK